MALFDFDIMPSHPTERESIIRWRFQQDLNVSTDHSRLSFRCFHSTRETAETKKSDGSPVRVLAAAIQHKVLGQYEQVCAEAGLLPVSVGIQGLQLFDACRTEMEGREEMFFSSCLDDQLFFVALRNGSPFLLRNTPLRRTNTALRDELAGTIQFYDEQCAAAHLSASDVRRPLILVGPADTLLTEKASRPEYAPRPVAPQVEVRRVIKESFSIDWPKDDASWISGLSAMASLVCR
jgi:hypothetical protein